MSSSSPFARSTGCDRHGTVAFYALVGLSFFLVRELYHLGTRAGDYLISSDTERDVALRLDPLRDEEWLVVHDIRKDHFGNVDHFGSGPNGAFAIETKSGRNRADSRSQAVGNAVWAKEKFGERWVTAILCVGTDPPAQPLQQGYVWVVGIDDLVPLLRRGKL